MSAWNNADSGDLVFSKTDYLLIMKGFGEYAKNLVEAEAGVKIPGPHGDDKTVADSGFDIEDSMPACSREQVQSAIDFARKLLNERSELLYGFTVPEFKVDMDALLCILHPPDEKKDRCTYKHDFTLVRRCLTPAWSGLRIAKKDAAVAAASTSSINRHGGQATTASEERFRKAHANDWNVSLSFLSDHYPPNKRPSPHVTCWDVSCFLVTG